MSEAETALVRMLSVTTLRVHRLKVRPGIRRQKWRTLDMDAWHGAGQGHGDWGAPGDQGKRDHPRFHNGSPGWG